ncbi:MAG: cysteine desulfurase NifS [gamma proteobacterium symbiont of Ctena orbiculata]|nr:MAG: cysteine desulfurase NifS [gamma proteobacterium symbiont of Ctena orbiculata]
MMIYLDNNATTQPSPRVVDAMLPYLTDCFFNPSSSNTAFTGVDKARDQAAISIAQLLNAEGPERFVFTSGATESNNWVFHDLLTKKDRGRIIVSAIEHASVFEAASMLRNYKFEVVEAPVDREGLVILDELAEILSNDTLLVSIMAANNETGVLQPLEKIGNIIRAQSPAALFHTDATQAIGKISVDLQGLWSEVDLLSFSAHKFHGPKGIGGLYIREALKIEPMLRGGGQERGLRSGTTNTPALAGLAAAVLDIGHVDQERIQRQRDEFEKMLIDEFPDVVIHSRSVHRLPNTSMFSCYGMIGEEVAQILAADGIIVGAGSACSSGAGHPSKTMLAMGVPYDLAEGSLRVSICADTPSSFAERFIESISRRIRH